MLLSQNLTYIGRRTPKVARTRACENAIGTEASVGTKLTSGEQLSKLIIQSCCLSRLFRVAHFGVLFLYQGGWTGGPRYRERETLKVPSPAALNHANQNQAVDHELHCDGGQQQAHHAHHDADSGFTKLSANAVRACQYQVRGP